MIWQVSPALTVLIACWTVLKGAASVPALLSLPPVET
jgi:hypothetical protein